MDDAPHRARFDWLVEMGGASGLGLAAGYAALKAAPSFSLPGPAAMTATGFACFGLGLGALRAIRPEPRAHVLPELRMEPIAPDELLLDQRLDEPLLLDQVFEDEVLLLNDRLGEPEGDSRVVQLFAAQAPLTPGQLKDRIDRHLAGAPRLTPSQRSAVQPDATQALYAALNELKRSLR